MWSRVLTERPKVLKFASVSPAVVHATETSSISSLFPGGTWYPSRNDTRCSTGCPWMRTGTGLTEVLTMVALTAFTGAAFGSACAASGQAHTSVNAEAASTGACFVQFFQNIGGAPSLSKMVG